MNERVQVLLSTHDGEAYLPALLASVLAQDHELAVLARDDGSHDRTPEILADHGRDGRVVAYRGPNVGPAASFFELLARSDAAASHVAFCDQDDVWLPDKLSRALALLRERAANRPALYCGRQLLVDATLAPLGPSRLPRRGPAFANALVENIATGCTVVIDARARAILLRELPRTTVMHDWWAYLVTTAVGVAVFDERPCVLYRQHGANAIGAAAGWRARWGRRMARWRDGTQRGLLMEQARELARIHGPALAAPQRRLLDRFLARRASRAGCLRYALAPDVFRQARSDDLILRLLMALGRL